MCVKLKLHTFTRLKIVYTTFLLLSNCIPIASLNYYTLKLPSFINLDGTSFFQCSTKVSFAVKKLKGNKTYELLSIMCY